MQLTWYCLLVSVVVALLPLITEGGPMQNSNRSSDQSGTSEHETTGDDFLLESVTGTPKSKYHQHWVSFKKIHRPNGYSSIKEELYRNGIFEDNMKIIDAHNNKYTNGLTTFNMGVNQFSDMPAEEYSRLIIMNGIIMDNLTSTLPISGLKRGSRSATLPTAVDWRDSGYVTPVKNQGQCGSCWSFSATGALEGQLFRSKHTLVSLSEQNLIDCSSSFGNLGCKGGWPVDAYKYIKNNSGIDTEASYPYTKVSGSCKFSSKNIGATVTGYVTLPKGNEKSLQQTVSTVGPISVVIDASNGSFQHYKSGVYNEVSCSLKNPNHAVLVVGYGSSNGTDYWIVKNSWATTWGDKGYILMSRNQNNQCGIANWATYPTV